MSQFDRFVTSALTQVSQIDLASLGLTVAIIALVLLAEHYLMEGMGKPWNYAIGLPTSMGGMLLWAVIEGILPWPVAAFMLLGACLAGVPDFFIIIREQRRAALSTRQEAEAFVRDVQERIDRCFGPWPQKTPLKPRIASVVERDAYTIENVIFESRPDFLVTANLYIPKGRDFPLPGVVGTCGHSATGKAIDAYQSFAQGLARQGYVVLLYDPLGQGERLQYPNAQLKSEIGVGVREHLHAGNQQFLVGEFIGSWRAWDGIRALDYLLTRKEVDPRQIGVTGNSGGGTMTTWLCGVERRWTMGAPACFVTTISPSSSSIFVGGVIQFCGL